MIKKTISLLAASLVLNASAEASISISTVLVGDAGNENRPNSSWGGVSYEYHIGTYPVTNSQYVAFLNSVAAADPHDLYSPQMTTSIHGGITRDGSSGSFTYSVKEGFGNKPVNFVSYWDAARFANWLTNGQPTGAQSLETTEAGMYFLGGVTNPDPSFTRTTSAWESGGVAITSMNEWFKAAYYDPTKGDSGGGSWNYWNFPTRTNTLPTPSIPNGTHANSANCDDAVGGVTDVGAYSLARSYYGTFDQGGNVWELNDTIYHNLRGGSFASDAWSLGFSHIGSYSFESATTGFRVSSLAAIGEPSNADFVEFELERSVDLLHWETVPMTPSMLTENGKLRLPADGDTGFFRLQIRRVENE